MRIGQAAELFRAKAKEFFGNSTTVIFANQSRTAKPKNDLVTIMLGNPKRPLYAPRSEYNDDISTFNPTAVGLIIDLFTNGKNVTSNGVLVGSEDTAMDRLYEFKDYLESDNCVLWEDENDIAITVEGITYMSGIINDTTYQYRARMEVLLSFTHITTGLNNSSLEPV